MMIRNPLRIIVWALLLLSALLPIYWMEQQQHRPLNVSKTLTVPMPALQLSVPAHRHRTTTATTTTTRMKEVEDEAPRAGFPSYLDHPDAQTVPTGILTQKPRSFFQSIQSAMDQEEDVVRCQRYGFPYGSNNNNNDTNNDNDNNQSTEAPPRRRRRIFYGSLIADESWEVLELIAAEAYGLFSVVVFVESNRTQDTTPRPWKRLQHGPYLQTLFGNETIVNIRPYVNEDVDNIHGLTREQEQRNVIVQAWKEWGMQPTDIALIADIDEMFSRDFLKALQVCDVPTWNYEYHHCHHSLVKLRGLGRVFESTPECSRHATDDRPWVHPDVIIGACVEGIGNHPPAPRLQGSFIRMPGWGGKCTNNDFDASLWITDGRYPSWNAADFRRTCGGYAPDAMDDQYDSFTSYHFHNFVSHLNATRFKHFTYGHPNGRAFQQAVYDLGEDYKMMYRCVQQLPYEDNQKFRHSPGGLDALKLPIPIYFHDPDYRRDRHQHVVQMIQQDLMLYSPAAEVN